MTELIAKKLGSLVTTTKFDLPVYEVEGDERIFVSLRDLHRLLGFRGTNTRTTSLAKAVEIAKKKRVWCDWLNPKTSAVLKGKFKPSFIAILDLPDILSAYAEVTNRKVGKKRSHYADAVKMSDWIKEIVIPIFYESTSAAEATKTGGCQ